MTNYRKPRGFKQNFDAVVRAYQLLSFSEQKRTKIYVSIQILMTFLDLIGVGLVGILSLVALSGVNNTPLSPKITWILETTNFDHFPFEKQCALLGISSVLFLVTRSVFSIYFTRKIIFFLSASSARLSSSLVGLFLSQSILGIHRKSSQESIYALTRGVDALILQVLATFIILVSDVSLIVVLMITLFILDPLTAASISFIFGIVLLILFVATHSKSKKLGNMAASVNIEVNEEIIESINSFRELFVRNAISTYIAKISNLRFTLAKINAELNFIPYIAKYAFEVTLVVGALVIFAIQFSLKDISHAIATFSVFIAAGTRVSPSLLRVQQGFFQINMAAGLSKPSLELIDALKELQKPTVTVQKLEVEHPNFEATIHVQEVEFTYPNRASSSIKGASFFIGEGEFIGIVGPSGSGKSTLLDLLLGLLEPNRGIVKISGLNPSEAIKNWPGAIGYVSQDTGIINGTLAENISVGYSESSMTKKLITDAIQLSLLESLLVELPEGVHTKVGENGSQLSGGQRQRLGIARAVFTKPKILILDESTSALDSKTEADIIAAIDNLKGKTTVIMVAHRLSTIQKADKIIYMGQDNEILVGSFPEIRSKVPDFENQAKILGL